ncbi:MAG: GNAT family N-acetyltransferase [Vibrio sp.]
MLETSRTKIELLRPQHAQAMLEYYQSNSAHLAPWEPLRTDDYYTLPFWDELAKQSVLAFDMGQEYRFVVFHKDHSRQVIGVCNFTGVIRGVFQACLMGYSLDHQHLNQGYMTEIVHATSQYMFEQVGLHRIMSNYMPNNIASERVLQKLGFEREGYAKRYLKIAGQWQDHILTAKIHDAD